MDIGATIRKGANSLYEDQLHAGFESLRFGDFLEEEFRENYLQENFQKSRLVIGLALIVVVVVTLINVFATNGAAPMMGRFGMLLMSPMLLLTLLASYSGNRFIYHSLLSLSALVIGIAGAVSPCGYNWPVAGVRQQNFLTGSTKDKNPNDLPCIVHHRFLIQ